MDYNRRSRELKIASLLLNNFFLYNSQCNGISLQRFCAKDGMNTGTKAD